MVYPRDKPPLGKSKLSHVTNADEFDSPPALSPRRASAPALTANRAVGLPTPSLSPLALPQSLAGSAERLLEAGAPDLVPDDDDDPPEDLLVEVHDAPLIVGRDEENADDAMLDADMPIGGTGRVEDSEPMIVDDDMPPGVIGLPQEPEDMEEDSPADQAQGVISLPEEPEEMEEMEEDSPADQAQGSEQRRIEGDVENRMQDEPDDAWEDVPMYRPPGAALSPTERLHKARSELNALMAEEHDMRKSIAKPMPMLTHPSQLLPAPNTFRYTSETIPDYPSAYPMTPQGGSGANARTETMTGLNLMSEYRSREQSEHGTGSQSEHHSGYQLENPAGYRREYQSDHPSAYPSAHQPEEQAEYQSRDQPSTDNAAPKHVRLEWCRNSPTGPVALDSPSTILRLEDCETESDFHQSIMAAGGMSDDRNVERLLANFEDPSEWSHPGDVHLAPGVWEFDFSDVADSLTSDVGCVIVVKVVLKRGG